MSAMMMEERYINAPYPGGAAVNREILADIDNELPDEEIINKLRSTPDLMMALWGEGDLTQLRYVPLHHAASRGRQLLLEFILAHRAYPELVNLTNDNYFTALRYANRSNLPHIVAMLNEAGATEDLPNVSITCACGSDFVFTSDKQARFRAQNYQAPRHCGNCRAVRKAQNNGGGDRNGGYQQRGYGGGGFSNNRQQEGYGGGFGGDRNGGGGYGGDRNGGGYGGDRNVYGGYGGDRNGGGYGGDRNGGGGYGADRNGGGYGGDRGGGGYGGRGSFNNFNNGGGRGRFQPRDGGNNTGYGGGYQQNNNGGGYGGNQGGEYQQRPQQRGYGDNNGGNGGYYGYNRGELEN